jgi:hypothetical protein
MYYTIVQTMGLPLVSVASPMIGKALSHAHVAFEPLGFRYWCSYRETKYPERRCVSELFRLQRTGVTKVIYETHECG